MCGGSRLILCLPAATGGLDTEKPGRARIGGKAEQGCERMGYHINRYRPHHFTVRRLVLEGGAEITGLQCRNDLLHDAASEEDTAPAHEHQRQVAGGTTQACNEKAKRFHRDRVGAGERRRGYLGRIIEMHGLSVGHCDGAIRSEEPRLNSSHVKTSYAVFCLKKKRYVE